MLWVSFICNTFFTAFSLNALLYFIVLILDKILYHKFRTTILTQGDITKVEIKAKDEEILDNKKLLDFFEKASESGFLDTCELKKKDGGNKKIDFKDKNLNIEYTENVNLNNVDEASRFFDRALSKRNEIIQKRLGL